MITRIILFAMIAGLVYLNYTTPKIEDHKAFLLTELQQQYAMPESMQERVWKNVDYSNFMICSFMKTKEDSKMISYGFLKKVQLANDNWVNEVRAKIQKQTESY